ncbi:MAG: hypothetical protein Q9193_004867, partial [Seirophora villosa]
MTIAAGGQRHIQITSILFAVAIITVLFRFVSHRRARTSPRADDWTLLAAVAFVFAVYVEGLVWVVYGGVGKHMTELSPAETSTLLKCSFLSWLTYALAFVLTKLSILLLYIRIFPVRNLRIACAVVGALVALLGAGIFAVGFAQCRPFRYIWDKSVPGGHCVAVERVFYGTAVSSLLLNTVVVALPMPVLWGLQMKRRHKVALILVFSLGGL